MTAANIALLGLFKAYVYCMEYYEISNIKLELLFGGESFNLPPSNPL